MSELSTLVCCVNGQGQSTSNYNYNWYFTNNNAQNLLRVLPLSWRDARRMMPVTVEEL